MMKETLKKTYWFLSDQIGLDPIKLVSALRSIPFFFHSYIEFSRNFGGRIEFKPCLHDRNDSAGSSSNEYFVQDLLVAQMVHEASPNRHLDVGSRVDGFVAHVASFREIEVVDVRPLRTFSDRIKFFQHDLMNPISSQSHPSTSKFDSISCLHAIEHFGLGRYGDPIDPSGWQRGLTNIVALLQTGGVLYLSTPIGKERVQFNANWVFNPRSILNLATKLNLDCIGLHRICSGSQPEVVSISEEELSNLANAGDTLGLFVFRKVDVGADAW